MKHRVWEAVYLQMGKPKLELKPQEFHLLLMEKGNQRNLGDDEQLWPNENSFLVMHYKP